MAELDNLSIQITASTKQASDSIDKLIATLGKLSGALNINGVESFANSMSKLATSINSIEGDSLKSVVKSAKSLSSISAGASKAGDAVTRLGKKLASDIDIKDKQGIAELTRALREFYSSTTASGMSAANDKIMKIATSFGTISGEVSDARRQALDFIAALDKMKVSLPMDWTKEYGDTGYGKTLRGMVGIKNTVTSGGTNASEAASGLGLGEFGGRDQDAFKAIAEAANNARMVIADTQDEIMTLGEALRSNGEAGIKAAQAMRAFNEQIATAVGMSTQQLGDAMFGNGYLGEETQAQSAAIQNFITMSERLMSQGNPFQNVTDGLMELSNINLSEETVTSLNNLSSAVSKIGGKAGASAGPAMREIASGLQALNVPVPKIGDDLAALAVGLRALGSGNIITASQSLPFLAEGIRQLNAVKITADVGAIAGLAEAIKQFGYAKVEKSIVNLPVLATELNKLITTLSKAPQVSQNTVELVKALGNLNVNARALSPATTRAGKSLDLFSHHARRAHKASFSLAAAIGKIYATYWGLFRIMGMFKKSIDLASDLTEVQNVVDNTFGQMKDRMEDFAKTSVETVGMSELTAKQIGSRYQSMGRNMGVPESAIKSTNDYVQSVTNGYADVADSMADVSINLTRLAGDMSSFYNQPYEEVAEDMEAIFTGQTRPLRKYGLDLTQATLQEWALANGMDVNIKKMTQAEKTLLRYQYVMANTTAAHGDFIRTQDTWANQTKLASENLKRLQVILGQIGIYSFKPLVANFNTAMNDIIHLAESTFNALGTIFGWQIEVSDVGIVDDIADGLEDVEDGYEGAGKEAKKFKNFLLGIDELNLLPDNNDNDNGSGAGSMLGATANGLQDSLVDMKETEKGFDSIYDTLYKLGARIGEVQKEWLKGIDWDSIFDKAEGFGKGLASFLNGYLSDAETFYQKGRFIANGINTIAHAIYGFFHEFDGYQFGKDIGFELNGFTQNLDWGTIQGATYEMAHDLTEMINGAIENINWGDVGRTIAEMMNTVQLFLSTFWNEIEWDQLGVAAGDMINSFFLNWDEEEAARLIKGKLQAVLDFANNLLSSTDFEMIGEKVGKFLSELNLADYADEIAALLWNLLKASFNLLVNMAEEAPIETALILAFGWMKFKGFGAVFGNNMASSISKNFAPALSTMLKTDLGTLAAGTGIMGKAALIGAGIGGAILAGFVGYNVGREIGKYLFPEDEMWYDEAKDFGKTIGTIIEAGMEGELKPAIALMLSDMGIDVGETKIGDGESSGGGARDDGSGTYTHRLSVKDAPGKSQEAMEAAAELRRAAQEAEEKTNLLMQSPISRYNAVVNNTVSSSQKMQQAINGGRESMERMEQEAKEAAQSTNVLYKILNSGVSSLPSGGGNVKLVAESMKHLNTQSLVAKAGIEQLNASIDNVSRQKDKTKNSVTEIEGDMKNISGMIGNTMSVAFQTIDTAKQNLVNSMNNMFSADMWSNVLSAVPKAFRQMWMDSINVMKQMWSEMAQWINANAKIEIPKTKFGKQEIGGGTVQLRIPKFDVGGSIPNDGSLFFANERGPEVMANMGRSTGIMNTDQMETAIANGMAKALANGNQNVTVVLNGDAASFFKAMVKENNSSIMRTGASPLRV